VGAKTRMADELRIFSENRNFNFQKKASKSEISFA